MYVNGTASGDAVDISSAGDTDTSAAAKIGTRSFSTLASFYPGKLKDLKIFSEAKSAGWVKQEYNRTKRFY